MGRQSGKKRRPRTASAAERARRERQRAARDLQAAPQGQEPVYTESDQARRAAARAAESPEEAVHVDSRDWREVKIQGREAEIVAAVNQGDAARAKQLLAQVRANAGGCEVCKQRPQEGEGFVLSTTSGRSERRWGHKGCLTPLADRWFEEDRAPQWTPGTDFFARPGEHTFGHAPEKR